MKRKIAKWVSYLTSVALLFGSLDVAAFAAEVEAEESAYVIENDAEGYDAAEAEPEYAETTENEEQKEDVIADVLSSEEDSDILPEEESDEGGKYTEGIVYAEPDEAVKTSQPEVITKKKAYTTEGEIKATIEADIFIDVQESYGSLSVYMEKYGEEVLFTAMPADYVEGQSYTYTWYYCLNDDDSTRIIINEEIKEGDDAKSDTIDIGKFYNTTSGTYYECMISSGDECIERYIVDIYYINSTLAAKVNDIEQQGGYRYVEIGDYYTVNAYNSVSIVSTSKEGIKVNIDSTSIVPDADISVEYRFDSGAWTNESYEQDGFQLTVPYGVSHVHIFIRDGYSEIETNINIEQLNVIEGTNVFAGGLPETIYYLEKQDEDGNIIKKHDAGYPIFSAIRMEGYQEDHIYEMGYNLNVAGVDLAIDDGESHFYSRYDSLSACVNRSFSGEDPIHDIFMFPACLELSEGEHKVTMTYYIETIESQSGEGETPNEYYSYTVSDTVNFSKEAPDTDTYFTGYSTQYILPNESVRDYSYFARKESDEKLVRVELYEHSESGKYGEPLAAKEIDEYVDYTNYPNTVSIYSIDGIDMSGYVNYIPGNITCYRTSVGTDMSFFNVEELEEDTYLDIVFISDKGNRYIKKKEIFAVSPNTDASYVSGVTPTVAVGLLGYDSTKDYIALTVYGYNVKEDSIPAFYSDSEMTEGNRLAYFDSQDPECALEGSDTLGLYFVTLKKVNPDADIWNEYGRFYYDVADDTVAYGYNQGEFNYSPDAFLVYAVEGSARGMKIRVSSAMADKGDTLEVFYESYAEQYKTETKTAKVLKDDSGLYVEFSNTTELYKLWAATPSGYGSLRVKNTDSSTSSKEGLVNYILSDASYLAKTVTNLYVFGNNAWEIHEFTKMGTPVYEGVAENGERKRSAVLTPEQVSRLAASGGVYRYCIKDTDGRIIETSTISFSGETYTITLMDGGEVVGSVYLENNASYSVLYNDYTLEKPGYKFDGWYTKASGGDKISATKKFTSKKNLTLYAHWSSAKYDIVYDSNIDYMKELNSTLKASGKTSKTAMTYGKSKNISKNGYSISGYKFTQWNTMSDGSGTPYVGGENVKDLTDCDGAVITLYAQWTPVEYSIEYKGVPDEVFEDNMSDYEKSYTRCLLDLELPQIMYREGYDFAGWYKDSQYKKPVESISLNQTGDIKVYAKWKAHTYKVTFDSNVPSETAQNMGLTGTVKPVTMTYDKAQKLPENKFKMAGYRFLGWSDGAGGTYADKERVMNLAEADGEVVNLYAEWEPIEYVIEYKGVSDEVFEYNMSDYPTTYTRDISSFDLPQEMYREGYDFVGWYKDSKYKKPIESISLNQTGTIKVYAKWKAHTYKVTFDSSVPDDIAQEMGLTGTVKPVTMTYDKSQKLPENKFKLPGYKFLGWDVTPFEGEYNKDTLIKDKASVKNLSTGSDVILYAQWELVTYKITYKNAVDGSKDVVNTNVSEYTIEDTYDVVTIGEPTREGYTFEGWYKDSKFKKPLGKTFTLEEGTTGNKTFYAKWKKN